MAKFDVNYESTLKPDAAFEKLKSFISSVDGIKKLDENAKINVLDVEKKITAESKQFKAEDDRLFFLWMFGSTKGR